MLGRSDRIAERRVHDHHALGAGGGNIDIVDPDARTPDNLQIVRGIDDILGNLGGRTDGEAIILADDRLQFIGRHARLHIDVAATFFENAGGVRVHLVRNEDFGLAHDRYSCRCPRP